jgi:hypothetical protein
MEKFNKQPAVRDDSLKPPTESKVSTIMNGMGNGMMLGLTPFALFELGYKLKGKNVPDPGLIFSGILLIGGMIGGGLFGLKEANAMEQYDNKVGDEIIKLRAQTQEQAQTLEKLTNKWANRVKGKSQSHIPQPENEIAHR